MARPHSPAIRYAAQAIVANALSECEVLEQLAAIYKSGYQAGRKASLRADLVAKGVASVKRMRMARNPKIPANREPGFLSVGKTP